MKKDEVIKPEFEVIFLLKKGYELKRIVDASNEYEAVLEASDFLSIDFDLHWSDEEFEVISVVQMSQTGEE